MRRAVANLLLTQKISLLEPIVHLRALVVLRQLFVEVLVLSRVESIEELVARLKVVLLVCIFSKEVVQVLRILINKPLQIEVLIIENMLGYNLLPDGVIYAEVLEEVASRLFALWWANRFWRARCIVFTP